MCVLTSLGLSLSIFYKLNVTCLLGVINVREWLY